MSGPALYTHMPGRTTRLQGGADRQCRSPAKDSVGNLSLALAPGTHETRCCACTVCCIYLFTSPESHTPASFPVPPVNCSWADKTLACDSPVTGDPFPRIRSLERTTLKDPTGCRTGRPARHPRDRCRMPLPRRNRRRGRRPRSPSQAHETCEPGAQAYTR